MWQNDQRPEVHLAAREVFFGLLQTSLARRDFTHHRLKPARQLAKFILARSGNGELVYALVVPAATSAVTCVRRRTGSMTRRATSSTSAIMPATETVAKAAVRPSRRRLRSWRVDWPAAAYC